VCPKWIKITRKAWIINWQCLFHNTSPKSADICNFLRTKKGASFFFSNFLTMMQWCDLGRQGSEGQGKPQCACGLGTERGTKGSAPKPPIQGKTDARQNPVDLLDCLTFYNFVIQQTITTYENPDIDAQTTREVAQTLSNFMRVCTKCFRERTKTRKWNLSTSLAAQTIT